MSVMTGIRKGRHGCRHRESRDNHGAGKYLHGSSCSIMRRAAAVNLG
jgi:hypothetical protein